MPGACRASPWGARQTPTRCAARPLARRLFLLWRGLGMTVGFGIRRAGPHSATDLGFSIVPGGKGTAYNGTTDTVQRRP